MFHVKVGRESMEMESGTATLLFKKFRYHVMHNPVGSSGLLNEDFRGKLNLRYLASRPNITEL
jgi:hypothetical protein